MGRTPLRPQRRPRRSSRSSAQWAGMRRSWPSLCCPPSPCGSLARRTESTPSPPPSPASPSSSSPGSSPEGVPERERGLEHLHLVRRAHLYGRVPEQVWTHPVVLPAGRQRRRRLGARVAASFCHHRPALLLLSLPVRQRGRAHRCHVHRFPLRGRGVRISSFDVRPVPRYAEQHHGMLHPLRNRKRAANLRNWLRQARQVVHPRRNPVRVLPLRVARNRRGLVEGPGTVVSERAKLSSS